MKYKRILAGAFALALTLPLLTVSAHPGRTDDNGGHTDSDTGDYHYHHGYPAHDHYDIDADGSIDCPYDFDDQTGQNSGTSSDGAGSDRTPGTNWSGTTDPDTTHKTFSRLDLEPKETDAPSTRPAASSEPEADFEWSEIPGFSISVAIVLVALALLFAYICHSCFQAGDERSAWVLGILSVLCLFPLRKQLMSGVAAVGMIAYACLLLSPFIYLIKLGIEKLIERWKSHSPSVTSPPEQKFAPSATAQPKADPSSASPLPLPPQTFAKPDPDVDFRPVLLPESEVSPHTRCRDTCRYLWYETLMIRSRVTPQPSSDACIYIWTALFYTAVKTLRSQSSVDRIYSYFAETTSEFVTEDRYTDLVVAKVRSVYRELREPLNESGIDPRTANGRRDLWRFLEDHSEELNFRPDLDYEFLCASQRVWQTIKDVFPQAHPYPKAGEILYSIDSLPGD